ncbi:short-chain dehydrogenase [Desulfofustis limnaeus]|uniref:Short-chain dehydrogenase n=2 Tax=Desulfofustis limnaeus TaxID=2740163 RepID=A0ABN6M508_9BACT|nr:short-chain dehydrogenase [Desulfofustis limnaeus]
MDQAREKGIFLEYLTYDLEDTAGINGLVKRVKGAVDTATATRMALINNAGTVAPVQPVGRSSSAAVRAALHINLAAPMLLTSAFIEYTADLPVDRRILNISSGAARNPYVGWGAYCTTKAGLDMFTRCVGLEQKNMANPVKIIAVAPGIVDTAMQESIRNTAEEDFPNRNRFIALHEKGLLTSPDAAAENILRLFLSEEIETGGIYDIRHVP